MWDEESILLIAYLDEFGHVGPYISPEHNKYNVHPVFGYGGFVIPEVEVRQFGGFFEHIKENLLRPEIEASGKHARQWEKKGSSLLTSKNYRRYRQELSPALERLSRRLISSHGQLFFFGQEKPLGPVSETCESSEEREAHCLIQTMKRIGTIGSNRDEEIMVIMDSTDTHNRKRAVATLGSTIFSRRADPDMKRIVDIPLQADSELYGTMQFADWLCALYGRLSHYHFVVGSDFGWSVGLANDMFKTGNYTSNSTIWTNEDGHFRANPRKLHSSSPYWEMRKKEQQRKSDQKQRNSAMFQQVADACSPQTLAKLHSIK